MEAGTAGVSRGGFGPHWLRSLGGNERRAFNASFMGFGLDAFDLIILTLSLSAIGATFGVGTGATGTLVTVTLAISAVGGIVAGVLADRIGRVKTLMITVGWFSVFTALSGFAQTYEQLLFLKAMQGLGFGGEWATGAALIAEAARPEHRGRLLGLVQASWAVGWGLAAIAWTLVFSLFPEEQAWRYLFFLGILPALLILYLRRNVKDADVFLETRKAEQEKREDAVQSGATKSPLAQIFSGDLLKVTIPATVLATGIQGGYYAMFTWVPTFLKDERGLTVVGTGSYLAVLIVSAFVGYVSGGYVHDRLGRRRAFALFAVASAVSLFLYVSVPPGGNAVLLIVAVPLGFFSAGAFSGFGSYLAELFPTRARGAGQGFAYNAGRAIGAMFPLAIGFLATIFGLGGAIIFGCAAYGLALVSLLFLPETKGKSFTAVN